MHCCQIHRIGKLRVIVVSCGQIQCEFLSFSLAVLEPFDVKQLNTMVLAGGAAGCDLVRAVR